MTDLYIWLNMNVFFIEFYYSANYAIDRYHTLFVNTFYFYKQ